MRNRGMAKRSTSILGRAFAAVATAALPSVAAGSFAPPAAAQIPGIPQVPKIPAFLPTVDAVPESDPMAIDGLWRISSLNKRIRIERGRAYAVDSWLHLFVLQIGPDMVVLQNFRRERAGVYTADDLPLQGKATFRLTRDGNMRASIAGLLGPVTYTLVKVREDDRRALDDEITAMTSGGDRDRDRYNDRDRDRDRYNDRDRYDDRDRDRDRDRARDRDRDRDRYDDRDRDRDRADDRSGGDSSSLADCKKIGVDSNTGDVVCKD